jgi:hypothetical protein
LAQYPSYESTWTRFEGEWDVQDLEKIGQQDSRSNLEDTTTEDIEENATDHATKEIVENTTETTPSKKHRTFQAVDTACSGSIFYRFRFNIKPSQFMDDMIQRFQQLQQSEEEKKALATTIRHCSRWLPLDYICHVTTERITDCFANRVLPECITNLPANTTIAIVSEIRNNLSITKPDLIDIIAPQLPSHLK